MLLMMAGGGVMVVPIIIFPRNPRLGPGCNLRFPVVRARAARRGRVCPGRFRPLPDSAVACLCEIMTSRQRSQAI